jgi:tetratricopeptide (TPR) repeat protein
MNQVSGRDGFSPPPDTATGDLTRTADLSDPEALRPEFGVSAGLGAAGYEILGVLGRGGMGVVYRARQFGLDRLVALKMIRGGSQARPEYFSRFRIEALAVARLRHPNIVQIYDIGEAGGLPFVALELLDGGSLDDRLAGNPQPGRPAAELIATLARAVHAAHGAGIVHRDLKPSNVLFGGDGVPRITDFGLAKRLESDSKQTESGAIMGSPSYMAPEQARGHSRDVGPAADIHALGAIFYEMLTGRPPFKGATPMETVSQVIDDDPVPPSRLVTRVARDLETICLKCLNKEPMRRYDSALSLAEDLARYLAGEPIKARRTPLWERGAKWARRRPVIAASWMLAVLLGFGAIAGLFVRQQSLLERSQRIVAAVSKGSSLQREADAARSEGELDTAREHLSDFLPELRAFQDDAEIRKLTDLLVAKRGEIGDRLTALRSQQAERERLQAERERFQRFRDLSTDALFHDTQFTGLDLPSNQAATRHAVQAVLNVYAAPNSDTGRESPDPAHWALGSLSSTSPADRAEIAKGCYELLLVLAEAEPTPQAGLRRLDQAARLHPPTRAYHLRRAACLVRAGDMPTAERERGEAERLQPADAFDHFLAGQERYKRGDPMRAIRHFNNALRDQPDHFWAQCLSAICWLQLRQPVQAGASLSACLKREPEFAWLYILRGFASSLIPAGSGPEEIKLRFEAAEADYRRAMDLLEQKPNDELRYVVLVNRGLLRFQRDDRERAASDLTAAIRLNDRPSQAYAGLAEVYRKQGKPDAAVEQFGRAIDRRPDWAPLYRARADVSLARQDSTPEQRARALRDLEQAIRLERPDNPVLARDHTNRGRLLYRDHREAEALAACDAALKVVPNYPDALRLRIDLLLAAGRYDEVIRSCDALMAGGTVRAPVAELRGLARAGLKDYAGAIEDATLALALSTDKAHLLARRGWLHILADAPRLALRDFEEALRRDPSSGEAYTGRGAARVRLGQVRDGLADAEKALGLGKPTSTLLYNAARIYAQSAIVAGTEARRKGQEVVVLVNRYQDRAVMLVREALRRLPADRRAAFWRDSIQADPALRTLRRRIASPDLAGPAASSTKSENNPDR